MCPKRCCGPFKGARYQRFVDIPFKIERHIQSLVDRILYGWPQLEVDISLCNGVGFSDFSLDSFCIPDGEINPELNVIVQYQGIASKLQG